MANQKAKNAAYIAACKKREEAQKEADVVGVRLVEVNNDITKCNNAYTQYVREYESKINSLLRERNELSTLISDASRAVAAATDDCRNALI